MVNKNLTRVVCVSRKICLIQIAQGEKCEGVGNFPQESTSFAFKIYF